MVINTLLNTVLSSQSVQNNLTPDQLVDYMALSSLVRTYHEKKADSAVLRGQLLFSLQQPEDADANNSTEELRVSISETTQSIKDVKLSIRNTQSSLIRSMINSAVKKVERKAQRIFPTPADDTTEQRERTYLRHTHGVDKSMSIK